MLTNKTPWVILLILWMMGSTWWHVCKIKQLCADAIQPSATGSGRALSTTPGGADGYTIADGNQFRLNFPGNFSFAMSGANANLNTLGGSLEPLVTYLKAHRDRTVDILGYYAPAETNSTTFPNLGLARAEGMKQYLVQQGIQKKMLTTKGIERNLSFTTKGDSLYGGLGFAFWGNEADEPDTTVSTTPTATTPVSTTVAILNEPTTEKELAEGQKYKSVFEPIDLYFPLSEANYIKTEETKKFFDEATAFLKTNKTRKLSITGHTDNSGPDDVNRRLSLDRANDVKVKLRKSGINADQITVQAKGETEPKADNKTLSGRKANRRVTVVVQ